MEDAARLRLERDLFRRLLSVSAEEDASAALDEALALVVELTGARRGYLELRRFGGKVSGAPLFARTLGLEEGELDAVRRTLSSGIVAEALQSGRAVSTASAVDDPRFSGQASVVAGAIRAVLCVPLGAPNEGPLGVLYLQDRGARGPFPEADRELAELFAAHAGPALARLVRTEEERARVDYTEDARRALRVSGVAGRSRALAGVLRALQAAAPVPFPVLLTGESGTGKTALARVLHESSPRRARPFVEVSCANLPETLLESELFGAEKGAHSTATRRTDGKVEAARGGTLFLDEVGELPLAVQAKLLTFLQSKRFYRLGSAQPLEADVRVVAATNRSLPQMVADKAFREDLYYRLNVLEVRVPPLAERPEDVGPIALAVAERIGRDAGGALALSPAALAALETAEWPGNVRQLENVVSRGYAAALASCAREGALDRPVRVEAHHLFPGAPAEPSSEGALATYQEATRRFQGELVRAALEATGWNVAEASRRLGLARSHLNELVKAHGLVRPRR